MTLHDIHENKEYRYIHIPEQNQVYSGIPQKTAPKAKGFGADSSPNDSPITFWSFGLRRPAILAPRVFCAKRASGGPVWASKPPKEKNLCQGQ